MAVTARSRAGSIASVRRPSQHMIDRAAETNTLVFPFSGPPANAVIDASGARFQNFENISFAVSDTGAVVFLSAAQFGSNLIANDVSIDIDSGGGTLELLVVAANVFS